MIAKARNITYGAAYTEYAAKKDQAIFVGSQNMVGDFDWVFDNSQLDDVWLEFKEAGADYARKGKEVTRDLFVFECSPTSNESANWTKQDWYDHAKELLEEIDKVSLQIPKREKRTNKWILDENGKKKLFRVPKTQLTNSKWMAMLHRDSQSGIYHLHILASRFTADGKLNNNFDIAKRAAQAAEIINQRYGWEQAMDIRQQHIDEINGVINDILVDMNGDEISWKEFKATINAATYTDYKGKEQHYRIRLHPDDEGNVGYSVLRGKSKFTASDLGQKMTHITYDQKKILKDIAYGVLRDMNEQSFNWNSYISLMAKKKIYVSLKHDSKGNVVNYSVMYGGKQYNASQIGPKLTAKKIIKEWGRLHDIHTEEVRHEQVKQVARNIPFVSIEAYGKSRDGQLYIGAIINGQEYPPKPLLTVHQQWYILQKNQKQAMQDLLIHYFADEIQKAQIEDWKQRHFDAGKMPFGITIGTTYGAIGSMGDHFWLKGEFTLNGNTKQESREVSRDDYIKWNNSDGDDARAVVCNTVGRDLIKDWRFPSITELQNIWYDSRAPFDTVEGLSQAVETFNAFTEQLCSDFAQVCGEVATTYLSLVTGGAGGSMSVGGAGGGGHDTGGWGKKKDDDDLRRGPGIMGQQPRKKGKGI